ncbi:MAG TPA: HEAT repeat domain-containing protein [Pirellulales bacterium]
MTFFVRPIAMLAMGSLLVAGCGSDDHAPPPVEQPAPTTGQPTSPGQVGGADRTPAELPTFAQATDLADPTESARRGFRAFARQRPPFSEWTMRQTAFDALSRIGELAVPKLITLLDDSDVQLRSAAVQALARIGPEAHDAVQPLMALVEADPEEIVRKNAVRALGQIGPAAAPAVDVLIEQARTGTDTPATRERPARSFRPSKEPAGGERLTPGGQSIPPEEPADER